MKMLMKFRLIQWLPAFVLFSFVSCTKELSNENGKQLTNGDFYATINGKLWNADSLQLIFINSYGVSINGLSKTGGQISMTLPVFKTGTYTLNASSDPYAYYANILSATPAVYFSNAGTAGGTITISAIDTVNHLVSGSFNFTLIDPDDNTMVTVTQGVFYYVPYSGNPAVIITPPPGSADTLKATVGSNPFNAEQILAQPANGQLVISGVSADGTENLALLMPENILPGTYNLDLSGATITYGALYYTNPQDPLLSEANGTLTIISNDVTNKRISGNFNFKGTSLTDAQFVIVTNGYFDVNY
jgi:hypothetical protein